MTTLLLRIASVVSLLFTVGHTLGGLKKWSPMGENDVLKAMMAVHFDTMGANRSYLDFFMGFGWLLSVAMLLQTVLLWQLASLARTDVVHVRPMILVFAVAAFATGVLSWRFLFPVPALFSGALLVPLVVAYVVAHYPNAGRKRWKLAGGDRFRRSRVFVIWRSRFRPLLLRQRGGRPQLKREPLGGKRRGTHGPRRLEGDLRGALVSGPLAALVPATGGCRRMAAARWPFARSSRPFSLARVATLHVLQPGDA